MLNDSRGLTRRQLASLLAGALATVSLRVPPARGQEEQLAKTTWQAHLDAILNGKEAVEDKVTIDMPEMVENGNLVPFTVAVEPPEDDTQFIQAVHIITTANDSPPVVSFYFTPLLGTARASSRMRLAQSQEVIALAQSSNGDFYIGRRSVEVIVGCCGD